MNLLKKHWLFIVGAIVTYIAYRSLAGQIAANAANANGATNAAAPALTQSPIFTPNAGGYDNAVSGVTSGLSSGTDGSTSMLATLAAMDASQKANDALAITGANQSATQSVALNSSVSNTVAQSFSTALTSFLSSPNSNVQTLNIGANPTLSGGINFTAQKDINLAASLTNAQAANYAPTASIIGFSNTPVAPAAPATLPTRTITNVTQLNSIYQNLLGRNADPSGASYYMGWDAAKVISATVGSSEYKNKVKAA